MERYLEENADVQAFLLTSPTYDGIVSDIKAIAEVVHRHKIPLIVDEAHGAHLHFSDIFRCLRLIWELTLSYRVFTKRCHL